MQQHLSVREYTLIAALAAISAVVELIHIGYQSPQFGMWIDIVATTWIIAFFLFGMKSAALTSLLGAIVITLFAPSSWLGASMKWFASMPTWLIFYLWLLVVKKDLTYYKKLSHIIIPLILALIIRNIVVIPLNYYYAIPIWTGMTTAKAMQIIPWYVIMIFNIIQGILEVVVAWIIVFRFKISRFATWNNNE
jgi:riboflavin transporter